VRYVTLCEPREAVVQVGAVNSSERIRLTKT
jgi:hypothetical protein